MAEGQELPAEFIGDFIEELGEHIYAIEEELLAIDGGKKGDGIDGIFRAFHTIKSSAFWIGFNKTLEICHHVEAILNDVRKRGAPMDSKRVDLLLDVLDVMKAIQRDREEEYEGIESCVRKVSEFRNRENIRKSSGAMRDAAAIWKRDDGDISVLMLEGEMGLKGTDKLVSEFIKLEDDGRIKLVLDIEKVTFIASSGIGSLALTLKNLRGKGGDLKLVNPTGDVKEKLEITELDKQFDICTTVKEAMSRF